MDVFDTVAEAEIPCRQPAVITEAIFLCPFYQDDSTAPRAHHR